MTIAWHPLDPDFSLRIEPLPPIPPAMQRRVDTLWAEQSRRHPALFDGPTFLLLGQDRKSLVIAPSTYRYTLARRLDPSLSQIVPLRPLAVCGLLFCRDGLVLGHRAAHVTAPSLWENAPAGTLASADPAGEVLRELEEELGVAPDRAGRPLALGIVDDGGSGTCDIVFRIDTDLAGAAIERLHRAAEHDEYDGLAIVPIAGLAAFLESHRGDLVATVERLLAWTAILPG